MESSNGGGAIACVLCVLAAAAGIAAYSVLVDYCAQLPIPW